MPGAEPAVRAGAVRDAGAAAREEVDLGGVELHAVRVPDVVAGPAEVLGVLPGAAAELRERVGDVLVVLGQVGVEHHPLVARRARRRRASARSRPRRASRARGRPGPSRRATDRGRRRRRGSCRRGSRARARRGCRAAGRRRSRRRSSRRGSGGSGCRRSPAASIVSSSRDAVREEVEMVGAHGAARERELREAELRRDEHVLGLHARPDRVERLQPAEEQRVLPGRDRLGQRLVEMMVGVDEARRDDAARGVDDCPRPRRRRAPTAAITPSSIRMSRRRSRGAPRPSWRRGRCGRRAAAWRSSLGSGRMRRRGLAERPDQPARGRGGARAAPPRSRSVLAAGDRGLAQVLLADGLRAVEEHVEQHRADAPRG